jgi:hypothetical protein
MLILGKNSDDTGTQLERLTKRLLEAKGYKNISVNHVTSGGQELDVVAEYEINIPGGAQNKRLIAECKAYREPVSITDWLKFLGKLYAEEARLKGEVIGLFVALSGVNGNVSGNYDELSQHRESVSILTSDGLLAELAKIYKISSREEVIQSLTKFTSKNYLQVEAAYYNEKIYWVFTFPNNQFSVLNSSSEIPSPDEMAMLSPLIVQRLSVNSYLDFKAEAVVQNRINQIQKVILASLFQKSGHGNIEELAPKNSDPAELESAISFLADKRWIKNNGQELVFVDEANQNIFENLTSILTFLFSGNLTEATFSLFFGSEYLDSKINADLFEHIKKVQANLACPPETRDAILNVLRWSPSALLYALNPDPLIVTHRIKQPEIGNTDEDDFKIFKREINSRLMFDFKNAGFTKYFFEKRNLREIEISQHVLVKSHEKICFEDETKERHGMAKAHENLGGGYVHVLIIEKAPQPWERGGLGGTGE